MYGTKLKLAVGLVLVALVNATSEPLGHGSFPGGSDCMAGVITGFVFLMLALGIAIGLAFKIFLLQSH